MKYSILITCIFYLFISPAAVRCTGIPVSNHKPPDTGQAVRTPSPLMKAVRAPENPIVHDVGKIWNGTFIRHVFEIKNTGKEPWEIRDIIEGDGVRAAGFTKEIPVSGKGEVILEVSTRRLKGKINMTAQALFKSPQNKPPLELVITGEVMTSVEIAPDNNISFTIDKGKILSWHFLVTSPRKRDFNISSIETSSPYLISEYRLLDKNAEKGPGSIYNLKISLAQDAPIGKFREMVKIHTNIRDSYQGEIFFNGEIEGPVMYRPVHFKFTALKDGSFSPARISLSNRKGESFKVTGIETDSSDIQWKENSLQEGRVHIVDLLWTGDPGKKLKNGKIVVLTDIPEQDRIDLPYVVFPYLKCAGQSIGK